MTGERLAGPLKLGHTNSFGVFSVGFSLNGDEIASCDGRDIHIWNGHSSDLVMPPINVNSYGHPMASDSSLGAWTVTSNTYIHRTDSPVAEWKAHVHIVYSIAVSYNGKFIASGSSDKTMTIRPWDTTTFTQIRAVLQHGDWVYSVAILPDGSHFVSGGDDNKLHMWNITDIIPTSLLENMPATPNNARPAVLPSFRRS